MYAAMIDYYMPQLQAIEARIRSRACLTTIATTERYRRVQKSAAFQITLPHLRSLNPWHAEQRRLVLQGW